MKILLVNDDGYGAEGLMALYEALKDIQPELVDMGEFEQKLRENVKFIICPDKEKWAVEYVTKPSDFNITRDSLF